MVHDVVAQDDREGFVAHESLRTGNRVAQPAHMFLANVMNGDFRDVPNLGQEIRLPVLVQMPLQLRRTVEMILDRALGVTADD